MKQFWSFTMPSLRLFVVVVVVVVVSFYYPVELVLASFE